MYGWSQGHPTCSSDSERQSWTLSFVACLSFLTCLADYIHPLPGEMKERRWTVVYKGGLYCWVLTHFLVLLISPTLFFLTVYTKGLLSSDLMYSVASILFKHNKTQTSICNHLWLWIYSAINILHRNSTFHQQANKRTFSLIYEMSFFSANA